MKMWPLWECHFSLSDLDLWFQHVEPLCDYALSNIVTSMTMWFESDLDLWCFILFENVTSIRKWPLWKCDLYKEVTIMKMWPLWECDLYENVTFVRMWPLFKSNLDLWCFRLEEQHVEPQWWRRSGDRQPSGWAGEVPPGSFPLHHAVTTIPATTGKWWSVLRWHSAQTA